MTQVEWQDAIAVADAVLYEGYLLYPYRASSDKNRMRWQFGVLVPPGAQETTGEHSGTRTECLCEPRPGATLHVRLRFLHQRSRTAQAASAAGFSEVPSLAVGDREYTTWNEAIERHVDLSVAAADALENPIEQRFQIAAETEVETLDGGRLVRRSEPLEGRITVSAFALDGPFGGVRLRVDVDNLTPGSTSNRADALPRAFLGAHLLLALSDGAFLSLTEPPEWARVATSELVNERTWPVLVGSAQSRNSMLSAPIILYDYPSIAPESAQALYDGTEIDEILTLRTMTLTAEEKRQARATDDRARDLLDRIDGMPPQLLDRLHGTIRYLRQLTMPAADDGKAADEAAPWWDPAADASVDPHTNSVLVDGVRIAKGCRVQVCPRRTGTDAQDMFLAGRTATEQAVLLDVDGSHHVAVTLDDDPGAELQTAHGRFRYFAPDELRPLTAADIVGATADRIQS
jgi:hypothetical protein